MDKYILVSEGPTDFFIIEKVAQKLAVDLGKNITIHLLEPQKCATGGGYRPHGWSEVKKWCKKHSNKDAQDLAHLPIGIQEYLLRQSWRALLAMSGAQGLIIQIDSDIANFITDIKKVAPTKKQHCTDALLFWLNEPQQTAQLFLAVCAQAIESWLLATHSPQDQIFSDLQQGFNYEDIDDYESRLVALGYTPTRNVKGVRRLKKSPSEKYKKHADKIAANLANVRARCSSAEDLCVYLS